MIDSAIENHVRFVGQQLNIEMKPMTSKSTLKGSYNVCQINVDIVLSYDVTSGSEITSCNKIDKPLVVYRFTGSVMTSITTLRT